LSTHLVDHKTFIITVKNKKRRKREKAELKEFILILTATQPSGEDLDNRKIDEEQKELIPLYETGGVQRQNNILKARQINLVNTVLVLPTAKVSIIFYKNGKFRLSYNSN
jgi:hypothetical protein